MNGMSIIKSTDPSGEVNYWGPFPREEDANEYIAALWENYGRDTVCEVFPIINVYQYRVVKRG